MFSKYDKALLSALGLLVTPQVE